MASEKAVLVGAGQVSRNPKRMEDWAPWDPAHIMRAAASSAAEGAGGAECLAAVDTIACVEPLAWGYESLARAVADPLGIPSDAEEVWVPAGGNSPQDLLHTVVERIRAGETRIALIAGCEALASRAWARKSGQTLDWPAAPEGHDPMRGQKPFSSDLETRHGLWLPIHTFPLYENALRASAGRSFADQIDLAAGLLSKNSRVAAQNPYAWFPTAYAPEEIAEVTPDNRLICYPYTKRMNAIIEVDQGAAILVMSESEAAARGLIDRAVHILGGAGGEDPWFVSERPDYTASAGLGAAARTALEFAGLDSNKVGAFDFYSCFPSAIELALDVFGLSPDDPRPFSLTGGLAYAGGPGNAYTLHSLSAAWQRLSGEGEETAIVTGVGMANTKHTVTVLSTDPARIAGASGEAVKRAAQPAAAIPEITDEGEGPCRIETYTIEFERAGAPAKCILVLRMQDGRRTLANGGDEAALGAALMDREPIGRAGRLWHNTETRTNRFEFA
jgi:acetyl-CoA C-acetyltransferase